MANLLEVLITCDSNNTLWTTCVWDPQTGTSLMTYRGGGTAQPRTLAVIGEDYIASVEKSKPVLHVWQLNSLQTVQGLRFILPGKANAIAFTQDGTYCVAGIDEKIYVWQIASGSLLTILNRHYQKVIQLQFTLDGSHFVSAAEDGMVMVWSLATVVAHPEVELVVQSSAGHYDPVHVFSDHSLAVTDLCISKTGVHGRLCTVSSDRTCKIYDLSTGEMLLNLVFDSPLSAVTYDVLELNLFIGSTEGKIYKFSLTNPPRNRDFLVNTEQNSSFISHTKAVTCLSVSLDGETLMSGSNDEQVILWHIRSKQPIRTIRHKGPITAAFFTVNLPAIFKYNHVPKVILHSLEKSLEKDVDEVLEIEVIVDKKQNFWSEMLETYNDDVSSDLKVAKQKNVGPKIGKNILFNKENKKENQEKQDSDSNYKTELDRMKQINSNLYALAIQKTLSNAVTNSKSNKSKSKHRSK